MIKNIRKKGLFGFTLVELLIVMSIIGVLAAVGLGSFTTAQTRGRDAQRKADLKQIAHALEIFYSDHGRYPDASGSRISACPYNPATQIGSVCAWGTGSLSDGKTVYFKNIPIDPSNGSSYTYRVVPLSSNQKFQLFAHLENTEDKDCINDDCTTDPNFAVTSANTNASE